MTKKFTDLHLIAPLLASIEKEGYEVPTPIQSEAIPHLLAGRDLLACAQTGTGKTAAFALPILQQLYTKPRPLGHLETRALILTPTRELALQIAESFSVYGRGLNLKTCVIFGGVGQGPQAQAVRRGTDIIVATPGRLMDLVNQRLLRLSGLDVFVLDEADRMLDMGFIHDIKKIIKLLPHERQNLFFSATMPREIETLAQSILRNPVKVEVTPSSTTVEKISQKVMHVDQKRKTDLLTHLLNKDPGISRVAVFTRTKHGANKVVEKLAAARISAEAIHGNKSQTARVKALDNFKMGRTRVLVATDIAARGIDVDGISHVINFELPNVPESYVHRIGRTARAGKSGIAISFCSPDERGFLRDIERTIRLKIEVDDEHPFPAGSAGSGASPDSGFGSRSGGDGRSFSGGRHSPFRGRGKQPSGFRAGGPRGSAGNANASPRGPAGLHQPQSNFRAGATTSQAPRRQADGNRPNQNGLAPHGGRPSNPPLPRAGADKKTNRPYGFGRKFEKKRASY